LPALGIYNMTDGRREERSVGDSSQDDRWCPHHEVTPSPSDGGFD
jgi:hypothetical protein